MIETICALPKEIVIMGASLVGAIAYSLYTVYLKRKEDKKVYLEWPKFLDTVWQSAVIGYGSAIAIGCSWQGIVVAFCAGVGIDKITNKIKINETQILNLIQIASKLLKGEEI